MYLCKLGQNPLTGSEDNTLKQSYTDANGIHIKINLSPHLGLGVGDININLLIYVNLKSVHMTYLLISLLMEYNYL